MRAVVLNGEFFGDENGSIMYGEMPEGPGFTDSLRMYFDGMPLGFIIPFMLIALLIVSVFLLGLGSIIVRSIKEKRSSDAAGLSALPARVFGRRTETQGGGDFRVRTVYHLAFELENGERKEFEVPGEQFGTIAEGDRGTLTFKGTKFEKFERNLVS